MRRIGSAIVVGCLLLTLPGCASFDGRPKPVLDLTVATTIPDKYKVAAALEEMDSADTPEVKQAYRNRTIAIYLAAADARYMEFLRNLSAQSKGTNGGLDLGILAATSVGSIAGKSANGFAALGAFLTGTRSTISKELYFDRTLPALLAAMDASRIRARAALLSHLNDSITIYPMELAFADLANFENAASIDGAISQITIDAGKSVGTAQQTYADATASCQPTADLQPLLSRLNHYIYGLADGGASGVPATGSGDEKKLQNLLAIALDAGIKNAVIANSSDTAQSQADAIVDATYSACTKNDLAALFTRWEGITKEPVP